ncbi:hypothetical protein DMA15_30170 [Streptomyces sp. WAC 01529]|uniref:DUF4760 domain-containing protein n=1 Tax=Streptomyces sp. WAC 01529 TaxID=2203205 RepID=UPI000F6B6D5B|nr:hypothetical protein [Streptomyces sp. WAC 01529]AZM56331.1 hypothetical protein DMA15_30170 [Streptomyces sp. WAC 01529]
MDISIVLNVLALMISVCALTMSITVARRQLNLAHNSNLLPVMIDAFRETRSTAFLSSMHYIREELSAHPADDGYRNLPQEAQLHIRRVGLFYDDIGKLVAHGIVEESLIFGAYGGAIARIWDTLAPFVYAERQKYHNLTMFYFEDLASRASPDAMQEVHRTLGLGRRPPAQG